MRLLHALDITNGLCYYVCVCMVVSYIPKNKQEYGPASSESTPEYMSWTVCSAQLCVLILYSCIRLAIKPLFRTFTIIFFGVCF